jgi:hypothetical protein
MCLAPLAMVIIRNRRTPPGGDTAGGSTGPEAVQLPIEEASPPSSRAYLSNAMAILDEFYLMTLIQSFRSSVGIDGNVADRADVHAPVPILHHT